MVARSSSDAPTYSSAETRRKEKRREIKIPRRGGGGGELGACVLGSPSQNVEKKYRKKALVGTLVYVVAFFPFSAASGCCSTQQAIPFWSNSAMRC